jgi:hypothetical protein
MYPNCSDDLNMQLAELREFLDMHSDAEIRNALAKDDFESLVHLPASARQAMADCPDLCTDIWWYMEIKSERKLEDVPCVHIAYATSSKLNRVIESSHGVFFIRFDDAGTESVGIGYCPWCAKRLNTSAAP